MPVEEVLRLREADLAEAESFKAQGKKATWASAPPVRNIGPVLQPAPDCLVPRAIDPGLAAVLPVHAASVTPRVLSPTQPRYFLHLFSGQRRERDVQYFFDLFRGRRELPIIKLSIDVANHAIHGDMSNRESVNTLLRMIWSGEAHV